jgi:uncharacterized membrane protein YfcA
MTTLGLLSLVAAFFFTAAISVVTGGTSLLTVPVMLSFGFEPHVAVATNMLSLIFLSLGGTLPLLKGDRLPRNRLWLLIAMTLAGSLLGASILLVVPSKAMPLVIAAALIVVTIFSLTNRKAGLTPTVVTPSFSAKAAGVACTFLLGVYGGFFSGGYVALLTAAFVAFFHFTFIEAVALTKVLNMFSSLVATLVFAREGLVDWRLGLILSVASFAGGLLGAVLAKRVSNLWLRRIFVVAVIVMALKTLLLDVPWANL